MWLETKKLFQWTHKSHKAGFRKAWMLCCYFLCVFARPCLPSCCVSIQAFHRLFIVRPHSSRALARLGAGLPGGGCEDDGALGKLGANVSRQSCKFWKQGASVCRPANYSTESPSRETWSSSWCPLNWREQEAAEDKAFGPAWQSSSGRGDGEWTSVIDRGLQAPPGGLLCSLLRCMDVEVYQ